MICTDEEFKEEASVFWNKNYKYLNENYPFDITSMAYDYVRNNKDFKYKDHVEAGVLVTCLVDYGYIEFTKRENDVRYHSLTEKGLNFIKEKQSWILKDIIKQKLVIDIDTAPNWDKVYSGKCLVANSEIILLLNFNDETGEFDGFSILKNKDFEKYRVWEKEDYAELKNDNSVEQIKGINIDNFCDLKSSLNYLKSELIAIYTYDDEDSYFVGKILSINDSSIELKLINKDSKWTNKEKLK